jgi:hypothetical protein
MLANKSQQERTHTMTPNQAKRLKGMSRLGKAVWFKNKGRPGHQKMGTVVDEVYIIVNDYKHMIQKIQFNDGVFWHGSKFAYRASYYTYDGQKKTIKWGQFSSFLSEKEYKKLLSKAKKKGWIL